MKKLIAILMVLAIVAGFAFADASTSNGSAAINITASVDAVFPTFALTTVSGVTANKISTVDGGNQTTAMTYTSADLLGSTAIKVTFGVGQTNASRAAATYQFSYTATPLILLSKNDGTSVRTMPSSAADITAVPADEKFGVSTAGSFAADSVTGISPVASTDIQLAYDGTVVGTAATASAPLQIAHFDVTWENNGSAKAGNYQATVTLTVAAQ